MRMNRLTLIKRPAGTPVRSEEAAAHRAAIHAARFHGILIACPQGHLIPYRQEKP